MEKLFCGDCLERMKEIPDKSIDMIFADLPYGTTHNVWDVKIDSNQMWQEYKRLLKSGGSAIIFSAAIYHGFDKLQPQMVPL